MNNKNGLELITEMLNKIDPSFKQKLNEDNNNNKPKIFRISKYDYPSKMDLIEINACKLNADEILDGFSYTIIGKGINDSGKIKKIQKSIKMLADSYPEKEVYKEAYRKSLELKSRWK